MTGQKRKYENPMPQVDDGWWASVLAEENRASAPIPARSAGNRPEVHEEAKNAAPEKKVTANWAQVKDLYMRD